MSLIELGFCPKDSTYPKCPNCKALLRSRECPLGNANPRHTSVHMDRLALSSSDSDEQIDGDESVKGVFARPAEEGENKRPFGTGKTTPSFNGKVWAKKHPTV